MLFFNKGMLFENKDLLSRPSNEDGRLSEKWIVNSEKSAPPGMDDEVKFRVESFVLSALFS